MTITEVQLKNGKTVKLTATQVRALKAINKAGTFYSYNGISRATIAVLERLGLVTVEWTTVWVETGNGYRGVWRQRPQLNFAARINHHA